TLIEAKLTLGYRLALAYSAAYDADDMFSWDMDRWQITFNPIIDKTIYSVGFERQPWCSISMERAFEIANNPAIKMLRSGVLDVGVHQYRRQKHDWVDYKSPLDKRLYLLPWINPVAVRDLENAAIDADLATKKLVAQAVTMRVKRPEFGRNKDKMLFKSGHGAFDTQTVCLGTGNYWAPTLHGEWIRPEQQLFNGGTRHHWGPGMLQDEDLGFFRSIQTPEIIINAVKKTAKDRSVQFYAIFHFYRPKPGREPKRVVHGLVLTDRNDVLIRQWNTGPTYRSWEILDAVLPYLAVMEE
ncbi:hypothetical protein LCGC14_3034950, partial [marine sediment metagenome]